MNSLNIKERTLKNVSYSLLSFGYPIIIALFVTPIIVHYFGIKEYGVFIFINTLISLAGLVDLGISTAISKFIAERHGKQDIDGSRNLFKTANTLYLMNGVLGAVLIASSIFFGLVAFPSELVNSYQIYIPAFIYAGIIFFINSIGSLYVIVPTAYQRFDISSKVGIIFITVQQLGVLLVVFLNWSLNTLFFIQVLVTLVFYFVYRKYISFVLDAKEAIFVRIYGWDYAEAVQCYKFGVASFLNNLAGSSLTYLDRMIIPIFLGPSNLAYYSLPGSITNKIPSLSATLSAVVFPMASYFEGEGNRVMIKNLYTRSMRLIAVISTAITVAFVVFAYQLLQYWIGIDLADKATGVLIVLAVTNLILAVTGPLNSFLLGMGKLRALTITSVMTAIINATLLVLFLPYFGIIGAAWAYLLALLPYGALLYVTEKKYLQLVSRSSYYIGLFSKLFITSIIITFIDIFLIKPLVTSFFLVIIAFIFSCSLFIALYYIFGFFEKEDTYDILNFTRRFVGTFGTKDKN